MKLGTQINFTGTPLRFPLGIFGHSYVDVTTTEANGVGFVSFPLSYPHRLRDRGCTWKERWQRNDLLVPFTDVWRQETWVGPDGPFKIRYQKG